MNSHYIFLLDIFAVIWQKSAITQSNLYAAVGFGEITSANVVGYNAITIDKKNTIMSVQFQNVSGNSLSIQEAFPAQEGMTQGSAANAADQIQVQNATGGYDT